MEAHSQSLASLIPWSGNEIPNHPCLGMRLSPSRHSCTSRFTLTNSYKITSFVDCCYKVNHVTQTHIYLRSSITILNYQHTHIGTHTHTNTHTHTHILINRPLNANHSCRRDTYQFDCYMLIVVQILPCRREAEKGTQSSAPPTEPSQPHKQTRPILALPVLCPWQRLPRQPDTPLTHSANCLQ